MTPAARQILRGDVMLAEGFRSKPYRDTVGKLTIGYGRNLDDVGLTKLESEVLLDHDLDTAEAECAPFLWYPVLSEPRKRVIVEMVYNLGLGRFLGFRKMIAALMLRDYARAADEMLASKWATQVGQRAQRLADTMRQGR